MSDNNQGPSDVGGEISDSQLSKAYADATGSIQTRSITDEKLLILAKEKAKVLKENRTMSELPFFGGDKFRRWGGAAAFGVAGISLWITLQAPSDLFDQVEQSSPLTQSEWGLEAKPSSADSSDVGHRDLMIVEEVSEPIESELRERAEIGAGNGTTGFSDLSESDKEESPLGIPMTESNYLPDYEAVRVERQKQKQSRETVARRASEKMAIESKSLTREMAAPRKLSPVLSSSMESMVESDESSVKKTLQSPKLVADFEPELQRQIEALKDHVEAEDWISANALHGKLLEQYPDLEIPPLILEQLDSLREAVDSRKSGADF